MLLKTIIKYCSLIFMDFDIHLNFEIDFIPLSGKDPAVIL